jgi:hypothetical protein
MSRTRFRSSTLLRVAMLCIAIGPILPRIVHPSTAAGVDLLDGVRGLMLGLAIGLVYIFFRTGTSPAPGCGSRG